MNNALRRMQLTQLAVSTCLRLALLGGCATQVADTQADESDPTVDATDLKQALETERDCDWDYQVCLTHCADNYDACLARQCPPNYDECVPEYSTCLRGCENRLRRCQGE